MIAALRPGAPVLLFCVYPEAQHGLTKLAS
jgi:hypothetical protein